MNKPTLTFSSVPNVIGVVVCCLAVLPGALFLLAILLVPDLLNGDGTRAVLTTGAPWVLLIYAVATVVATGLRAIARHATYDGDEDKSEKVRGALEMWGRWIAFGVAGGALVIAAWAFRPDLSPF